MFVGDRDKAILVLRGLSVQARDIAALKNQNIFQGRGRHIELLDFALTARTGSGDEHHRHFGDEVTGNSRDIDFAAIVPAEGRHLQDKPLSADRYHIIESRKWVAQMVQKVKAEYVIEVFGDRFLFNVATLKLDRLAKGDGIHELLRAADRRTDALADLEELETQSYCASDRNGVVCQALTLQISAKRMAPEPSVF